MPRYVLPPGAIVKGWQVRIVPTREQTGQFRRDDGGRRFACNWAIAEIKAAFNRSAETGEHDPAVWSFFSLQKRWNGTKSEVAPWWGECSSHAYACGIADAAKALNNWHTSKTGKRKGPRIGFPRFHRKGKDPVRCSYAGDGLYVMGPRHLVLPRVGRVKTAENIRPIWRHIRRGTGRVLSATVREKAGRWWLSLRLEITAPRQPEPRTSIVGVDVGIGNNLLIVMHPDGTVAQKIPNPRALRTALADLRRTQRAMSRKTEDSLRWHKAKRRLGRAHLHVAAIRSDAIHKATTQLAKTHGTVVIEDLAASRLARGIPRHRKAWIDASAGELRRQLTYKAEWYSCDLWVADRWYPSSKTCSACGHINAILALSDRTWSCPSCGTQHDRDENAGVNLARLPASQAEAQSDCKTGRARLVVTKRVNHLGKVAA
jgi:putative transposase